MNAVPPVAAEGGCVFCSIVGGSVVGGSVVGGSARQQASVVAATAEAVAFLDSRPVFPGHTLVVPRSHVVTLADLPAGELSAYFALVQRIAVAVQAGLGADGSFVAINNVVSQSVPHLHTHVVPRRRKDGLRGFFWPRSTYASPEEAAGYASLIRAALDSP